MNSKLTLSIDSEVIAMGKRAAKAADKSLSKMVEDYFRMLGRESQTNATVPISESLQSLVGIGAGPFDERDYKAHRLEKEAYS